MWKVTENGYDSIFARGIGFIKQAKEWLGSLFYFPVGPIDNNKTDLGCCRVNRPKTHDIYHKE